MPLWSHHLLRLMHLPQRVDGVLGQQEWLFLVNLLKLLQKCLRANTMRQDNGHDLFSPPRLWEKRRDECCAAKSLGSQFRY